MDVSTLKKIIALLVIMTSVFMLAGCGKSGRNTSSFTESKITNQDYWNGIDCWVEEDYGNALDLLKSAVETGREATPESPETAYMEMRLGEFLIDELGKYDEGLEYEISAYTTFKKLYGMDDYNTVKASLNIASCDIYLDNYETAIAQLNDLYEELSDPELKGVTAITLAHTFAQNGETDRAKEWFDIIKNEYVDKFKNMDNRGAFYNNYGLYLSEVGEVNDAIESFKNALHYLPDEATSENLNKKITVYINLSEAYYDKGEDKRAAEVLADAYKLTEGSSNSIMHALCMEKIASVLLMNRRDISMYESAKLYLDKALKILIENVGENHGLVAKGYNLLAVYYQQTGNSQQAVDYRKKAIEIKKNLLLADTKNTAVLYLNLADAYFDKMEYETCIEYVDEGLSIIEDLQGKESYDSASALALKSWAYVALGDNAKAISLVDQALAITNKHLEKGFPKGGSYAHIMMVAGIVYSYDGLLTSDGANSSNYKKSKDYFMEAEKVYSSIDGNNSTSMILLNLFRGDALLEAGEISYANDSYRKAYYALKTMGASNEEISEALSYRLLKLYKAESPDKDARQWSSEWLAN